MKEVSVVSSDAPRKLRRDFFRRFLSPLNNDKPEKVVSAESLDSRDLERAAKGFASGKECEWRVLNNLSKVVRLMKGFEKRRTSRRRFLGMTRRGLQFAAFTYALDKLGIGFGGEADALEQVSAKKDEILSRFNEETLGHLNTVEEMIDKIINQTSEGLRPFESFEMRLDIYSENEPRFVFIFLSMENEEPHWRFHDYNGGNDPILDSADFVNNSRPPQLELFLEQAYEAANSFGIAMLHKVPLDTLQLQATEDFLANVETYSESVDQPIDPPFEAVEFFSYSYVVDNELPHEPFMYTLQINDRASDGEFGWQNLGRIQIDITSDGEVRGVVDPRGSYKRLDHTHGRIFPRDIQAEAIDILAGFRDKALFLESVDFNVYDVAPNFVEAIYNRYGWPTILHPTGRFVSGDLLNPVYIRETVIPSQLNMGATYVFPEQDNSGWGCGVAERFNEEEEEAIILPGGLETEFPGDEGLLQLQNALVIGPEKNSDNPVQIASINQDVQFGVYSAEILQNRAINRDVARLKFDSATEALLFNSWNNNFDSAWNSLQENNSFFTDADQILIRDQFDVFMASNGLDGRPLPPKELLSFIAHCEGLMGEFHDVFFDWKKWTITESDSDIDNWISEARNQSYWQFAINSLGGYSTFIPPGSNEGRIKLENGTRFVARCILAQDSVGCSPSELNNGFWSVQQLVCAMDKRGYEVDMDVLVTIEGERKLFYDHYVNPYILVRPSPESQIIKEYALGTAGAPVTVREVMELIYRNDPDAVACFCDFNVTASVYAVRDRKLTALGPEVTSEDTIGEYVPVSQTKAHTVVSCLPQNE